MAQGLRWRGCARAAGQRARVGPSPVRVFRVRSPCKHGAPLPPSDAPHYQRGSTAKRLLPGADRLRCVLPSWHKEAPALIPPPRIHRHRYHGVLAPNAPLRAQVTACARPPNPQLPAVAPAQPHQRAPAHYLWAMLLARIYEVLPLRCALCGGEMRIIAFVTERPAIHTILSYLGEPTTPPELAPARGPPLWQQATALHWDDTPAPAPEYVFDQRVSW